MLTSPDRNTVWESNLISPQHLALEEVDRPVPGKGEVSIEVRNCGICGSDIHAWHGRHPFVKCLIVLGHEFSGVIAALGPEMEGLTRGQKVTVDVFLHQSYVSNSSLPHVWRTRAIAHSADSRRCAASRSIRVRGMLWTTAIAAFPLLDPHRPEYRHVSPLFLAFGLSCPQAETARPSGATGRADWRSMNSPAVRRI